MRYLVLFSACVLLTQCGPSPKTMVVRVYIKNGNTISAIQPGAITAHFPSLTPKTLSP